MADASSSSSSGHGNLSPRGALKLAKYHLENARKTTDPELVAMLYNESRATLSRMEQPTLETLLSSDCSQDPALREEITFILAELDEMLARLKQTDAATEALTQTGAEDLSDCAKSSQDGSVDTAVIPRQIFAENKRSPAMEFKLPDYGERITDIPQLAYCLRLLKSWSSSPDAILDPTARKWLCAFDKDKDNFDRIMALATDVITTFTRQGIKDIEFIKEAVRLAPVVEKPVYRYLLRQLCDLIEQSTVLDPHQLECLAQVIQGASMGYLENADLVRIIELLVNRLPEEHQEPLALSVSRAVDAIARTSIEDLDHEELLRSISVYLDGLKATSDPRLVYQAAYTYQALQHTPYDHSIWRAVLQRVEKPIELMDNARSIDAKEILQQLQDIHGELECESKEGAQDGSGMSLLDYLKDGLSFECRRSWYPALRMVKVLLWGGQFTEFKKFVIGVPCRRNPAFQWGLCQQLRDLAASLEWDTKTRLNTVAFLEDIYRNDTVWGQQTDIKELVVDILTQLASLESVEKAADSILQQLKSGGNSMDRFSDQDSPGTERRCYPTNGAFPSLAILSLLDRLQDGLGVEVRIFQLRKQCLTHKQDEVYVEPRAKDSSQPYNLASSKLMDNAKEFIKGNRNVFLLGGSPGSGKSTFSRILERDFWDTYETMEGSIPLYVDMSTLGQTYNDLIGDCLRRMGFMDVQIQELKAHRRFILICDEYYPTTQSENMNASNKLNRPGGWHVKMIVCCRTEHLGSKSLNHFYPTDEDSQVHPELFQQAIIEPFNVDQVQDYLKQYVSLQTPHWKLDDYLRVFEQDRCLHDLSRSPLLLSLALDVLSRLVDSQHTLSSKEFNKVDIYDQIVTLWFERSRARLGDSTETGEDVEGFAYGNNVRSGVDYLKRLAAAIYKNQGGDPVVEYSHLYSRYKRDEAWKEEFFGQDSLNQIIREASPLKRCGNKFLFIHTSILEYGLALAVHDPQEFKRVSTSKPVLTRRGSMDSVMSFESNDTDDDATTTVDHGHEHESPLIWRSFVNDHSVLEFLEDRVHREPLFKQKLLAFIELSKTEQKWRTAAANSITILVGAEVSFNGADLQGIQVPGANLSYGSFESAQLQGADLRKTLLRNTRLLKANLSQAQMKGVQFGEFPLIEADGAVNCCAYSPDGKYVAISLSTDEVEVYSTSSWERIRTLGGRFVSYSFSSVAFSTDGTLFSRSAGNDVEVWNTETGKSLKTLAGHTGDVYTVAFSPQGYQVASGSNDHSIRLWDVSSGTCQRTLSGHTGAVYSVMFSPNDRQLASGSGDKTVRLWTVESGALHSTLSGHDDSVYSIAYSPQGHLIASGSGDKTVRLWNVESGTCQSRLRGHLGDVRSVAFSPLGNLAASGSTDSSIRLWDVESGSCRNISNDHDNTIRTVVFSQKGDHILSGSEDKTIRLWNFGAGGCRHRSHCRNESVRNVTANDLVATFDDKAVLLWDLDTGYCIKNFTGHSERITSVALSPAGNWVASGSTDRTVRLWDVETGVCLHVLNADSDWLLGITFSPEGIQMACCCGPITIRVWDAETGKCTQILSGHSRFVTTVAFSPTGNQLASGSVDKTVRLWDVKSGICTRVLEGHAEEVTSVAFSPKGDIMASGADDMTVRLWDVMTGVCRHAFDGHSGWVSGIAFSPNGDQLASRDYCSVRLWSIDLSARLDRSLAEVNVLTWRTKSGQDYLVAGRMIPNRIQLSWIPLIPIHRLDLNDATLLDVRGLSELDKRLLTQRGAIDVPALESLSR